VLPPVVASSSGSGPGGPSAPSDTSPDGTLGVALRWPGAMTGGRHAAVVGSGLVQPQPTPTRRSVLTGGLVVATGLGASALAGCTLPGSDDPDAPPPPPHPDVVRADEAAARERRLIAAYDVALERAPELTERLAPLRAEHAEHLAALGVPDLPLPEAAPPQEPPDGPPDAPPDAEQLAPQDAEQPAPPDGTEPGAPEPTPSPPPRVVPPPLPLDPALLLPALADLERAAATAHAGAAVRSGRGLAVVLASAAASEASHPVALQ
jgi:hypothetical protein